jgi:hypothetical protein
MAWYEKAKIRDGIVRLAATIIDLRENIKRGESSDDQVSPADKANGSKNLIKQSLNHGSYREFDIANLR